ncbi:MAG: MFS transporter [Clostridiaceae bacterium]
MDGKNRKIALAVFLLGIFMGAIDTGIVSPARTIIASGFKISDSLSVWMITIYSLAYAVAMPISAKISDRYGRRKIYLCSITIFALGSLLCGISDYYGNYTFFLLARVIQALGGGGIMPIATAYIGESFPPEKRGSALGMVGAIFGIATILGPTLGSSIINLAGSANWGYLFFINLPISIIIIVLALKLKEESYLKEIKKLDVLGSIIISALILSLMYSLTNLDFYNLAEIIKSEDVWPYLIIFFISIPLFIFVEKKAEDPVLNLSYFTNRNIAITLMISFIVGCGLMGVVFVPQLGENILKLKSGSGGYLVTLMAIFSGISAPLGGKLIDKYSAKLVLIFGFSSTIIGALILGLYVTSHPSFIGLFIGLAFMGLGMGFSMGTPVNYLMLTFVDKSEASTGQSTVSLIRSIGVTISPNLLITFIAKAGQETQTKIMDAVQGLSPKIPGLPDTIAANPNSFSSSTSSVSPEVLQKLQGSDVTTVVDNVKEFTNNLLTNIIPSIKQGILASMSNSQAASASGQPTGMPNDMPKLNFDSILNTWKNDYIESIESARGTIENIFQTTLNTGFSKLFIGAAIIASIGLIFTLLLKTNDLKESN